MIQINSNSQYNFMSHLIGALNNSIHFSGLVIISDYRMSNSKEGK